MNDNLYEILEVSETATIDEIKKSYRKLSMMYHPDKNKNNPEATAKFQKISEAYETLGDFEKKNKYDMSRNDPFIKIMNGNGPSGRNKINIEDVFSSLFGVPLGHMQGSGNRHFVQTDMPDEIVRIFHNGVQINPHGFSKGMQKPIPIIKTIQIPIDKILTGTTMPIDIERWIIENGN